VTGRAPLALDRLGGLEPLAAGTVADAHALIDRIGERATRRGEPYIDLVLADASGSAAAKIWSDAKEALDVARGLQRGAAVKVRFEVGEYQGERQLTVKLLRPLTGEQRAEIAGRLYGEGHELVAELACRTLVFDIETVPATERRLLPPTVGEKLARHAEQQKLEPDAVMGLSPLFGKIVSLAFCDGERDDAPVHAFVVPPDGAPPELPGWIRPVGEPDLLRAFWCLARFADCVVTFNGRGFDVPFLVTRSLVHGIPARVDLVAHRYDRRPHLDLWRVLTHGERSLGPSGLDAWCWALGIDSPKGEMDGAMVAPAYACGEIEKIATYNAADVRATAALYRKVRDGVLRFRAD
jgi:hypothetical protein